MLENHAGADEVVNTVPGNVPLTPTLLSLRGRELGIRNPAGNLPEEKVPFATAHLPSVQGGVDKWATSDEPATST